MSEIARGSFKVKLQPLAMEGMDGDAGLGRMSIDKNIEGDLIATTQGQMLTAMTAVQGSAVYVAVERVRGSLKGRKGSFALHHVGVMNRGAASLNVNVVPDSGTDELTGLTGRFDIKIEAGAHLYEFEYELPN